MLPLINGSLIFQLTANITQHNNTASSVHHNNESLTNETSPHGHCQRKDEKARDIFLTCTRHVHNEST